MVVFTYPGGRAKGQIERDNIIHLPVSQPERTKKSSITVVIGKPELLDDLTHLWTGGGRIRINNWVTLDKPPFPKSQTWTPGDWLNTMAGEDIVRTAAKSRVREALLIDHDSSYLDVVGSNLAFGFSSTVILVRDSSYEQIVHSSDRHEATRDGWIALPHRQSKGRRILDATVALLLISAALPLVPVVAGLVKMAGAGPIFVCESCVGLHGKLFKSWKFRTQRDAILRIPENVVYLWEKGKDETATSVTTSAGAFLGKTHIDKLPQLLNVLKGDLRLTGPPPMTKSQALNLGIHELECLKTQPGFFQS
jgi:lipopolysaccharide/colanic/teichoic acid biosynthesis glycosyltransferase